MNETIPADRGARDPAAPADLPALRLDAAGRPQVDLRAIARLAWPMVLNAVIQMALNLTDTAFVARVSPAAVAGVASVYWFVLGLIFLFGGIGMAVQPFAAQAVGSGRWRRASVAAWTGQWVGLALVPVFVLIAVGGTHLIGRLGLDAPIESEALSFWTPRVAAGSLSVVQMAQQSFFYGVGSTRLSLAINALVLLSNALFNAVLVLGMGLGVAGSAWSTNLSLAVGITVGFAVIWMHPRLRGRAASRRTWRPRPRQALDMLKLGLPMGGSIAFDLLGLAVFQLMMSRVSIVAGAATQVVMMLTSVAYMPGVGIGSAGTTLVGQSVGAGSPDWARRIGDRVIALAAGYMGGMGFLIALAGPWLASALVGHADALSAPTVALASQLLWVAAWYQLFDGLNLGSSCCLRGAGDTRFAAIALLVLSWGMFLPAAHLLAFSAGQGPVPWLPGAGLGATGGWWAATGYVTLLGLVLFGRWRSGRWRGARL